MFTNCVTDAIPEHKEPSVETKGHSCVFAKNRRDRDFYTPFGKMAARGQELSQLYDCQRKTKQG